LNNEWHLQSVNYKEKENENVYNCSLININNKKKKEKTVFIKLAPLLDPYKYLVGKYDISNDNLFNLPTLTNENVHSKIKNINNSAYVDSFFTFLNSKLIAQHNFMHGVNYYGSFIAIKNKYTIDVRDDLEYLISSDFFNKHKNTFFTVDNYDKIINDIDDYNDKSKLKPISIDHATSLSNLSMNSINDNIFEGIFENNEPNVTSNDICEVVDNEITYNTSFTIKSNSSCSSRSSHTSVSDNELDAEIEEGSEDGNEEEGSEEGSEDGSEDGSNEEEEKVNLTLDKFPVHLIVMEQCKNTLDDLLLSQNLSDDEWYSCLMQIIMILITYQKVFNFTHNDLHTNNVMFTNTEEKYIYYCYNNTFYKVPTFGRLFKIIDFGRSIYKYNGQLFCSDSFKNGEDAASQYNTEPFFNEKKPRLEPNYSFDICRLACSIFDYLIEDITAIKNIEKCEPIQKLIIEWCLDDKGINVLYKTNGADRYPDFKLYKMIARNVHNHTPQAQLKRKEFNRYVFKNVNSIKNVKNIINIDKIPIYT
jgi:hypothetical protein